MNREKLLAKAPLIVFVLLVVALLVGVSHIHRTPKFAQHIGDPAPVTDLPVLQGAGARFATKDWYGRPYVINFFASWCPECKAEHEELLAVAAAHIPVIGITFKDRGDKAAAFLQREGNPFVAVAQDDNGRAGIDWGLTGIPETFIIDDRGVIRWHHIGPLTEDVVTDELMPVWENVR
jgi:cytochrome c biogenesis protein CcmG/thiol:disulfide interchange protein DsbE